MKDKNLFIVTTRDNHQLDLTKGKELRSNNLYPFGKHNYAIYRSLEGVYVKGLNTGIQTHMLNSYEIIPEAEALQYQHPYGREEE
jgi:hypothetical protein